MQEKQTLTEHILYNAGAIRSLGSVDKGSTATDSLDLEKERGISIKSAATSFIWNNTKVNLIDTPGHVDFSSEVARSLCVLDAVVLVVSAVEGVQAHTLTLAEAIKELKIPLFIFINKIDRQGADSETVLQQIKKELNLSTLSINKSEDEGLENVSIHSTLNNLENNDSLEELISQDETLLELYLNGDEISKTSILDAIKKPN